MRTNKRSLKLRLILAIGFTLALSACETLTIQNRNPCFVNGEISLGATCSNTIGDPNPIQLTTDQVLDIIEARAATSTTAAHPPGVFETAADYGQETTELEVACRILGNSCSYALQSTIANRKTILTKLNEATK